MKAYIGLRCIGGEWVAEVVSEQDYYECGPFARSYRTTANGYTEQAAIADATKWAQQHGLQIVSVYDI